jgi:predicted nucleic acid-binding protein
VSYLLDTNVVSEWVKPHPSPGVIRWLADVDEDRVYLSIVTLAELRHGVDRMPAGQRRTWLDQWLQNDLLQRFEGRVLGIDAEVASTWGRVMAQRQAIGRPIGVMDAWIAATAVVRQLALVTRNVDDFVGVPLETVNPWEGR